MSTKNLSSRKYILVIGKATLCFLMTMPLLGAAADTLKPSPATVSLDPYGGILFKSTDGQYTANLGGYFQVAGIDFFGDKRDTVNNVQNFNSAATIPDSRLDLSGTVTKDWEYEFSYDFSFTSIADAYLRYDGFHNTEITGGQFKPDFASVGNMTTRSDRVFLYDPLPDNAFVPPFVLGLQAEYDWTQWGVAVALALPPSGNYDQDGLAIGDAADPIGTTARVSFNYKRDESHLLYLDLGNYLTQTPQRNYAQFRAIPEMRGRQANYLVDTGTIHSSGVDVPAGEFAAIIGPFFADGGYYAAAANQEGGPNLFFDGYDIEAGYFFTGEHRNFDTKQGEFGIISPVRHSYGAWQIAGRYSYLDLTSKNIVGGRETNESVILNWYPKNRFKIGLEYLHAYANPSSNGLNRGMNVASLIGQVQL